MEPSPSPSPIPTNRPADSPEPIELPLPRHQHHRQHSKRYSTPLFEDAEEARSRTRPSRNIFPQSTLRGFSTTRAAQLVRLDYIRQFGNM